MASVALDAGAAQQRRSRRSVTSLGAASGLGLGVALVWFSLLVLIPLTAVVVTGTTGGWAEISQTLRNQQTWNALGLTFVSALAVTLINVVVGTVIAWVLVRDHFWGKRVIDIVIDVPFALPTIVAGLVLLSLYGPKSPVGVNVANTRTAVLLALAFVTLPFVVRTVQPVLAELDRDVEEAAASLGASPATTLRPRTRTPSMSIK